MNTATSSPSWLFRAPRWVAVCIVAATLWSALATDAAAVDLSGCWSGTWQSCSTGHHGPLRANFQPCDDQQYLVTFSGRFFKIFPFRYTVTLDVVSDDGENVQLSGSSFLGRMFGTFYYSASANGCSFRSTYSSCKDNGVFELTKCCE